jgi:hypothetical protein
MLVNAQCRDAEVFGTQQSAFRTRFSYWSVC